MFVARGSTNGIIFNAPMISPVLFSSFFFFPPREDHGCVHRRGGGGIFLSWSRAPRATFRQLDYATLLATYTFVSCKILSSPAAARFPLVHVHVSSLLSVRKQHPGVLSIARLRGVAAHVDTHRLKGKI